MQRALVAAAAVLASLAVPVTASADPNNNNSQKLRKAVTVSGILEHMTAFQQIADLSDGNRLAGSIGHERSSQYVYDRLKDAGYKPRFQNFTYTFNGNRTAPVLEVVNGASYASGFQFTTPSSLDANDSGSVTAPLHAVNLTIPSVPPDDGSASGCNSSDFAGFPAGAIALIQRGTCDFVVKIQNAINAGAVAVILMNEGNGTDPSRFGLFNPATTGDLPVLATTFAVGNQLANGVLNGPTGRTVHVKVDVVSQQLPTRNVIAETPGRDDNVVVVGAHLDGVEDGPGVNDNGSGSGTILEIAEQMHKVKPRNQVRFIWFSAEESGLLGSQYYAEHLTDAEQADIAAMLNFDMLASPNYVRFVYDGNLDSGLPAPPSGAPEGSGAIEQIFLDYFAGQGLQTEPTAFDGRSDYRDFIEEGIPAGGLFTGAEGIKTAAQAAIYGGAAGEQYDPCYHAFCDSLSTMTGIPPAIAMLNPANRELLRANGLRGLDEMADAAAHATITLAQNTEAVNGVRGKGNFRPNTRTGVNGN